MVSTRAIMGLGEHPNIRSRSSRKRPSFCCYALAILSVQLVGLVGEVAATEPAEGFCVAKDCDGNPWNGPCSESRNNCEAFCYGTWCPSGEAQVKPAAGTADAYYCGPASCNGNVWGGVCGKNSLSCNSFCGGTWCPLRIDGVPEDARQSGSSSTPPGRAASAGAVSGQMALADDPEVLLQASGWYCGPKSCNGKTWGGVCSKNRASCDVLCGGSWCPVVMDTAVEAIIAYVDEAATEASGYYCGPASCNGNAWGGACAWSRTSCGSVCGGTWCPPAPGTVVDDTPAVTDAKPAETEGAGSATGTMAESGGSGEEESAPATFYCGPPSCPGTVWGGACASNKGACSVFCGGEWCSSRPASGGVASQSGADSQPPTAAAAAPAEPQSLPDTWYCGPKTCGGRAWGGSCAQSQAACVSGCLGTWCPPMAEPTPPPVVEREPIGWYCGPPSCEAVKWRGTCDENKVACEVGCGGGWCPEYFETFLQQQVAELFSESEETPTPQPQDSAPRIFTIWGTRPSPFERVVSKQGLFEP